MFSVVIPLYNKEISIRNTIQSVLDQTCQDFEIVVVNDGSTDNSAAVVDAIEDDRIRLIHQKNQGVSAARNRGIQESGNEWIALLDADDLWEPNHLKEIKRSMGMYSKEKIFTNSFVKSDDPNKIALRKVKDLRILKIADYFSLASEASVICSSSLVVHRSCFAHIGGFNVSLNRGEDLDMWARLARKYTVIRNTTITVVYRVEAENRSDRTKIGSRSLVYNLNLSKCESNSEYEYFRKMIIQRAKKLLLSGSVIGFIRLYFLHKKHIKLRFIFIPFRMLKNK